MATVRMKKGEKYADIFDSPETIKQAQLEGYSVCEQKKAEKQVENEAPEQDEEKKQEAQTPKKGRTPRQ